MAVPYATARFQETAHVTTSTTTHDKATILQNIAPNTAFYAYTHGSIHSFQDCLGGFQEVWDFQIAGNVAQKTSDQPAYNLAFIDACNTGYTSALGDAFGVTGTGNRCFLGWFGVVGDSEHNVNWTNRLLQIMASGSTVDQAKFYASYFGPPDRQPGDGLADCRIHGDINTKLHGVYGGEGLAWYKPGPTP